jgi:hypothetical protein
MTSQISLRSFGYSMNNVGHARKASLTAAVNNCSVTTVLRRLQQLAAYERGDQAGVLAQDIAYVRAFLPPAPSAALLENACMYPLPRSAVALTALKEINDRLAHAVEKGDKDLALTLTNSVRSILNIL